MCYIVIMYYVRVYPRVGDVITESFDSIEPAVSRYAYWRNRSVLENGLYRLTVALFHDDTVLKIS